MKKQKQTIQTNNGRENTRHKSTDEAAWTH